MDTFRAYTGMYYVLDRVQLQFKSKIEITDLSPELNGENFSDNTSKYISKPDLYIVPIDVKISIYTDNG